MKDSGVENGYKLRDKYEEFLGWDAKDKGYFVHALTESDRFLDYVLIDEEGFGDYGKTRKLSENELRKYEKILGDQFIEMRKRDGLISWLPKVENFRVVDFCWYNCSEAPNYFDEEDDEFYEEV